MFVIDFDDTLFKTTGENSFKQARIQELAKLGASQEIYVQSYEQARKRKDGTYAYSNERHAKILGKYGFDVKQVLNALQKTTGERLKDFLFEDTIEFLEKLKTLHQPLILLSLGDPEFQKTKVNDSGIAKYFDEVFTVDKDKREVIRELKKTNEKIWLVNDKIQESQDILNEFKDINIVLKNSKQDNLPCFDTLLQIYEYIRKNT